ncbi:MAG: tetratricopeptide repeat protein [Terriglobales bacterium]
MSEVAAWGVQAYKEQDFDTAIRYLEQADRNDWNAQLYLAMSYSLAGQADHAQRVFFRIKSECPEAETRSKAETAFFALRSHAREDAERQRLKEKKEREEEEIQF